MHCPARCLLILYRNRTAMLQCSHLNLLNDVICDFVPAQPCWSSCCWYLRSRLRIARSRMTWKRGSQVWTNTSPPVSTTTSVDRCSKKTNCSFLSFSLSLCRKAKVSWDRSMHDLYFFYFKPVFAEFHDDCVFRFWFATTLDHFLTVSFRQSWWQRMAFLFDWRRCVGQPAPEPCRGMAARQGLVGDCQGIKSTHSGWPDGALPIEYWRMEGSLRLGHSSLAQVCYSCRGCLYI